jgi:hypothetical protein
MLKPFDFILMGVMVATAVVTYTIKHKTDLKVEEVKRLEAEIRMEKDTIDLLRADWALLTQPNRLHRIVAAFKDDLQLEPLASTQLAMPQEMPMLRSQLPQPPQPEGMSVEDVIAAVETGSRPDANLGGTNKQPSAPAGQIAINGIPVPLPRASSVPGVDRTQTGSVNR